MNVRAADAPAGPAARAARLYAERFGAAPDRVASAPGRVNLIGEHVDYHGGHVLPVATEWRTAVAVGAAPHGFTALSEQAPEVEDGWPPLRRGDWSDYVGGVVAGFLAEGPAALGGLRVAVASDVPSGAGVSSSAAIEVAAAGALAALLGRTLEPRALALIAHRAETDFVGMPCGVMDQMASALTPAGSALLLDCRTLATEPVPVHADLVLAESGDSHALRGSEYLVRRREGDEAMALLRAKRPGLAWLTDLAPGDLPALAPFLPPPLDRRVRHVVEEDARTLLAVKALRAGDVAELGRLVDAAHDSLRDLYECSTPKLDAVVAAARSLPGVLGARLVGAGWGGAALVVVLPGRGEEVAAVLGADPALALPSVRVVRPGVGLGG